MYIIKLHLKCSAKDKTHWP